MHSPKNTWFCIEGSLAYEPQRWEKVTANKLIRRENKYISNF